MIPEDSDIIANVEACGGRLADAVIGYDIATVMTAMEYLLAFIISEWPDEKKRAMPLLFAISLANTIERDIETGQGEVRH